MAKGDLPMVYRITNRVTGQVYIGTTTRLLSYRWAAHKTAMRYDRHPSKQMTADFLALGEDGFEVETLERAPDMEALANREWESIAAVEASGAVLYNVRRPITCEVCGRRFLSKPTSTRCPREVSPRCHYVQR